MSEHVARHPGRREHWREIQRLVRAGLPQREIADRFGMSRRELNQTMFWMRRAGWSLNALATPSEGSEGGEG